MLKQFNRTKGLMPLAWLRRMLHNACMMMTRMAAEPGYGTWCIAFISVSCCRLSAIRMISQNQQSKHRKLLFVLLFFRK